MPKKVLVTGANGFTGSQICRKLVEQGHQVRAMVRRESNQEALEGLEVELVYADLSNGKLPGEFFKGIELVYHIAAVFRKEGVPRQYFYQVNTRGTEMVLQAAMQADVSRFVHCSTIGVCGDIKNPPGTELTPYNPGDHYQETKMEGEKIALDFYKQHNFPVVVVRPGSIYGPGDTRFVKVFKSIKNGYYFIVGSGLPKLHPVYIDDLTDGMILASENPSALGEVFILTGSQPVNHNDFAACVAQVLGRPVPKVHLPYAPMALAANVIQKVCAPLGIEPPLYPRRLDFFVKNREFDISKARSVLGYNPKVDLRTGLARTAEWYQEKNYI